MIMKKGQREIYYLTRELSISAMARSPFLIPYKKKGDVLFFTDPVDEVVARRNGIGVEPSI
jgi:HSP90 family molecular chaperone